jgi:hypothetical protein
MSSQIVLSQEEIGAVEEINVFIAQQQVGPKEIWAFIQKNFPHLKKLPIVLAVNLYGEAWSQLYGWFLIHNTR